MGLLHGFYGFKTIFFILLFSCITSLEYCSQFDPSNSSRDTAYSKALNKIIFIIGYQMFYTHCYEVPLSCKNKNKKNIYKRSQLQQVLKNFKAKQKLGSKMIIH